MIATLYPEKQPVVKDGLLFSLEAKIISQHLAEPWQFLDAANPGLNGNRGLAPAAP